jgi:hypothetical protein
MLLGLCLSTPTVAEDAPPAIFDGAYRGSMELAPSGLNADYTGPNCVTMRPAAMVIRNGYLFLSYKDWHHHRIHYRGQVNANGTVNAYHRNGDGSASALIGNINGNQFTAEMKRGKCNYTMELTKV